MEKSRTVKAALLGFGTVGKGVFELLCRREQEIQEQTGLTLEIAAILVRDLSKERTGAPQALFTDNWEQLLTDPELELVIEVMGGTEPARTCLLDALEAGKHVVTANKDLLAEYGRELFEAAGRKHCDFCFEAAVGGGIPVIRPLKECMAANRITQICGIVNGTTNYILTKMTEDGMEFVQALEQAVRLGYAEQDATADIRGYDAARKTAILASIAFHSRVRFSEVHVEGIAQITQEDVRREKEQGRVIKLLAVARERDGVIEAGVMPVPLSVHHPLAAVRDTFNAILVNGDAVGEVMFYGRGAGGMPTASAVAGDVIGVLKDIAFGCTGRFLCTCYRHLPVRGIRGGFSV